jgi:hypothetical protein
MLFIIFEDIFIINFADKIEAYFKSPINKNNLFMKVFQTYIVSVMHAFCKYVLFGCDALISY